MRILPRRTVCFTNPDLSRRYDYFEASFDVYKENVRRVGVHWDAATDNHSRSLKIGPITRSGNSINLENIFFDFEAARRLNQKNTRLSRLMRFFLPFRKKSIELITNTFSQRWLEDPSSPLLKARLSELLIIEDIPNYLTPEGPYHPCIEEARENPYLRDFRRWIVGKTVADEHELADVKQEVEQAIAKAQRELFLKYYDPKTEYKAIGKTLLGFAADFVPGLPHLLGGLDAASEAKEMIEKRRDRWQAFLVSMKGRAARSEPLGPVGKS